MLAVFGIILTQIGEITMSEEVEINLTKEENKQAIDLYLNKILNKESYEVYKESGVKAGILNQAITDLIEIGLMYDKNCSTCKHQVRFWDEKPCVDCLVNDVRTNWEAEV